MIMEKYIYITILSGAVFICGLIPTLITLWLNERVKGSVQNSFNKSLEEVKKEHSKEISQFQAELSHLKSKENFKFTKLHEKRLEVLEKTNCFIYDNLELLKDYIKPFKFITEGTSFEEGERILSDKFTDKHFEFYKYFNYNLIYFDDSIENLLNNYFDQMAEIYIIYNADQSNLTENTQPEQGVSLNSKQAHTLIHEKLKPLKRQIEISFRKLLGE